VDALVGSQPEAPAGADISELISSRPYARAAPCRALPLTSGNEKGDRSNAPVPLAPWGPPNAA